MNRDNTHFDVVIAGGGMAGASLALALQHRCPSLKLAVVEAAPFTPDSVTEQGFQPSYDARSTALAYGSRLIFEDLGVWPRLREQATPIRHIHVSEKGKPGRTGMHAHEHQQGSLGYVVDNAWIGRSLLAALQDTRVHWCCPATVERVVPEQNGVALRVQQQDDMLDWHADLLVVADGGRSDLREQLDFRLEVQDYRQQALIANVTTSESHGHTAFERFTPDGPLALLPRGGREDTARDSALVWTCSPEQAEQLQALSEKEFLARLQKAFGWRLGRLEHVGRRDAYPLTLERVAEPVRPGVVLVGNAAHKLHPVAGQGFNLALRGLMRLTAEIADGRARGESPGSLAVLHRYLESHRPDEDAVVGFSDSMVRVFSPGPAWLDRTRGLGLATLDLVPPARRWFSRQAMGMGGRRDSLHRKSTETQDS